jgi:hypothetical protein
MGLLIAVLLTGAVLTGCGGSSGSADPTSTSESNPSRTASTTKTLTKTQFIARSEAFCKNSWREIFKRFAAYKREPKNSGKSEEQLFTRATGDIFLPTILFWYDDINTLSRPKGDDAQIEKLLKKGLQSTVVKALKRPYSFHSPAQLAALYRRSNRLVRGYGIKSCVVTKTSFSS